MTRLEVDQLLAKLAACETWPELVAWCEALPPGRVTRWDAARREQHSVAAEQTLEWGAQGKMHYSFRVGGWLKLPGFDVFIYGRASTVKGAVTLAVNSKSFRVEEVKF